MKKHGKEFYPPITLIINDLQLFSIVISIDLKKKAKLEHVLRQNSDSLIIFAAVKPQKTSIMANTANIPAEGQLIVDIKDMSLINDIKKAISMLRGVGKVSRPRRKRMTAYERSLRDLDEGRVYEAKDVDDLFKQIFG